LFLSDDLIPSAAVATRQGRWWEAKAEGREHTPMPNGRVGIFTLSPDDLNSTVPVSAEFR
jgi:hypothetical protein